MKAEIIEQAELRRVGHFALLKLLPPEAETPLHLTTEQAIGVGILATLLRIAEDISRLVGMYNTVTMAEKVR